MRLSLLRSVSKRQKDKNPNAVDVHGECPDSLRWCACKAGIIQKFGKIPQDMMDAIQTIILEMIVEYAQIEFYATSDPQGFSVTLYLMRLSIEYDPKDTTGIPRLDQQFKVVPSYTWFLEEDRKQRQLQVGRTASCLPDPPQSPPLHKPAARRQRRSRAKNESRRRWDDPDCHPPQGGLALPEDEDWLESGCPSDFDDLGEW